MLTIGISFKARQPSSPEVADFPSAARYFGIPCVVAIVKLLDGI